MTGKTKLSHRLLSILLCVSLLLAYFPVSALAAEKAITTVSDPETLTRPETIYGDNTVNAGKITVGKSVSDTDITVNGQKITIDGDNNFLVTVSQSAQVMGLTSEINVPLDVVIVFDTSGSMGNDSNGNGKNRTQELVEAANTMIASLMDMNDLNRVGVVAFSAHNAGGGTAGYNAANVLSELAHYDGEAATNHLTWTTGAGPSWAGTVQLVQGRSTTGGKLNSRYGTGGATNIQAGVTLGAQMLMEADTTVTINDQAITRTPIMILMSDGAPTVSAYENQWWNASQTNNQGPTNAPFMGNGFLTVLTASYYKNAITQHYYGTNPGASACSIYTVGVELSDAATQDTLQEVDLSYMTLNPSGEFVPGSDNYFYDRSTVEDSFLDAWNSYRAGRAFKVRVWADQTRHDGFYYFYSSSQTLQNANDYKNGADTWTTVGRTTVQPNILSSVTTLHYNDAFYDVTDVADLTDSLEDLLTEIARKAITVPTKVTTGDHNFDGYVTFYDPIGEYMEVKDMKGVLAGGYFYQGASFAQKIANFGTAHADKEFDALLLKVVTSRMHLSDSVVDIEDFVAKVKASKNQAYYNSASDYDNSIVWWGNAYDSGEEDQQVQVMGFADNDSIDYIEAQRAAGTIPAGADYVCRSYFFYGEAGGANPNPNHTYLYFMVRVQRELTAPYRETVVISAPASLLSMEKVLIEETFDQRGNRVYTATVQHQEPARVVYEVGLWDSITAESVSYIVSSDYASEKVNGSGSVNYNAATDTYNFFTNDWDRSQSLESHHRGLAKATFDAAADNPFYTYQQDTLLVDASGKALTGNPAGTTAYYVREYYEWTGNGDTDGTYAATKKTTLIEAAIPADAQLLEKNGQWYIPAGVYTAATLVVNGDDTLKDDPATQIANDGNKTGTSSIVAHPHRTGDSNNSHYTVFLGNNGMLSLAAQPYAPVKTVSVNLSANATNITDDEGKAVKVGDVLTYTVEVRNVLNEAADITVSDYVPLGTAFVEGSAGAGTDDTGHTKDATIAPDGNNVLTWTLQDVPAGQTRYVSFQVTVTDAALSLNTVPGAINNSATVQLSNHPAISTNTTHNPPYGKTVTDTSNRDIDGEHGFKVGDTLVYHIRFHNNAKNASGTFVAADVTVTDKLPAGTTFVSADNAGSYNAATGTVTWIFDNMAANTSKVVSFQVKINASAKAQEAAANQADGIEPASGEIYLPNTATIQVENNPDLTTNTTQNWADVGDMVIRKLVTAGGDRNKEFTINLTETTGLLSGKYLVTGGNAAYVEFAGGKGAVTIKHGQTLTVQGLPAGVIITVAEDVSALPGWTPTYNTRSVTITKGAATTVSSVSVTNTYALQPLTLTLKGEKHVTGVSLTENVTFGFVAQPHSSNPVVGDPLTGEVTVKNTGRYAFTMSPKVFTLPGIYKYTVSEINGGILGVNYDASEYVLEINVTDNGDGTMRATAKLDGNAFDMSRDAVSFTNSYAPEDTQLEFTADKALSGRDLIPGEFHFQITDGSNVYKGINDASGNIVFETIHFTAAGTYTYTMSEVAPNPKAEGVTYDPKTSTIVVTVTDQNGQLVPTVTVDGSSKTAANAVVDTGVTFENHFSPDDVPLILVANKVLNHYSGAALTANRFLFQVTDEEGNVVTSGTNAADGTVTFNTFYFSAEQLDGRNTKTFTYTVSEVVSSLSKDPNMLYDLEGKTLQVTLTRNTATGELSLSVNVGGRNVPVVNGKAETGITFTNKLNPPTITVKPEGTKTTVLPDGTDGVPAGLSFSFTVINAKPAAGAEPEAGVGISKPTTATTGIGLQIDFTELVYDSGDVGKTYYYWIQESNTAAVNGVTYDKTRYLMVVTIGRDSQNALTKDVQYYAAGKIGDTGTPESYAAGTQLDVSNIAFENKYDAKGHLDITATKQLTQGGSVIALAGRQFDFKLQRLTGLTAGSGVVSGSEIVGIHDSTGKITFATMNYSIGDMADAVYDPATGLDTKIIAYLMSEIEPAVAKIPGITYDKTTHVIYVRLTHDPADTAFAGVIGAELVVPDGNGGYTAVGSTDTGVVFENSYAPVHGDEIKFQISKTLNGRDLRPGEFEFLLIPGTNPAADVPALGIATNDANGIVTFVREISANATPGTYPLTIKEAAGNLAGVTYSDASYVIYVQITDDGNGSITATLVDANGDPLPETNGVVDLTDSVNFVNTYEPHDTHYTPEANKILTGRDLIAGEFSFQVQLINRNGAPVSDGAVYSGINNASGSVIFETISYADEGTYIYKLAEIPGPASSGITYDSKVYYLKVVVTDDGDGHLRANAGYYADESCTVTADVTFRNSQAPADAPVKLEATKLLVGRDLADKEFSFLVRQDSENGRIVATGNNDAAGNIAFSTFDITAADMADATETVDGKKVKTFTYVITESDNNVPGVHVDETVYTVTVTVTDDNTGALSAVINYPDGEPIVFTNTYKPASTQLPLVAFKTLTGKTLLADEFIFELKNAAGEMLQAATNDDSGVINFQALTFTAEDMVDKNGNKIMEKTFVYTVTEQTGNVSGTLYDGNVYTVRVTVTDDGKGNLTAAATYTDLNGAASLIRFFNGYTPPAIDVKLEGTKRITDATGTALTDTRKFPLSGFEFEVRNVDGKLVTTATSDAQGKITLKLEDFTAAGEYRFLISEKESGKPGYTTDPTIWCAHISIGYNAETGLLQQTGTYLHVAPESHEELAAMSDEEMIFVNVYDPADVGLTLKGLKKLDGRDLREHEFTFYMVDQATGLRAAETRNHLNGEIKFHMTYTAAGTYKYTVCEEIPTDDLFGVIYTTKTHEVTVEVTDDGTGRLKATVGQIAALNGDTVDLTESLVFENKYAPNFAEVQIEAWKHLTGREPKLGEFSFELVNKNDPSDKYYSSNSFGGYVAFETILYYTAGVYEYELYEVKGSTGGVTYDDHVYTVTVTVTDNGNGQLHSVTHYTNESGATEAVPVFTNVYTAAPVRYTPKAYKIFEGGKLGSYTFVLSGEGFETQEKRNNEKGEVVFGDLVFQSAGSYTFTITEKADETLSGIRWDTNVYTLVIEVADNQLGQLVIDEVTVTSKIGRDDLTFRNVSEELITNKDVFLNNDLSVSIDGKAVETGDILTYTISYTNYTGLPGSITITDTIPAYTAYVEGSANLGGMYADGVITWLLAEIAPDATVTVSFNVVVTGAEGTVENQAGILEGVNAYETNTVTNPITTDTVVKDVFSVSKPTVSIDGKRVKKGDVLIYTITYTNADAFAADVTITDTIPAYTAYVDGSADNGGIFSEGVITWKLQLAAGESKTVSFRVTVADKAGETIVNQAVAMEGENVLETNQVTNRIPASNDVPKTGDASVIGQWIALMLASGGGIIGTTLWGAKKKESEEE